jgi:hypothetical protein
MDTYQILITIFGLIIGNAAIIIPLFLWNRSESRSDTRRCEDLIEAIRLDIKDFHGRLCTIEERRK